MANYNLKASLGSLPKNKRVDVNVLVVTFIEDSLYYYYAPQLDVYGYGQTETEAKESFEITLHEFFRYTLNKRTLHDELMRMVWKVQKKNRSVVAPGFAELLDTNPELHNIVETRPFTKTHHNVQMPAFA